MSYKSFTVIIHWQMITLVCFFTASQNVGGKMIIPQNSHLTTWPQHYSDCEFYPAIMTIIVEKKMTGVKNCHIYYGCLQSDNGAAGLGSQTQRDVDSG